MFRKPRERPPVVATETPIRPSTGRPPTPTSSTSQRSQPASSTTYSMATPMPLLGKGKTTSKKNSALIAGKGGARGNGNIMSFFKKAEPVGTSSLGAVDNGSEESLFLDEESVKTLGKPMQTPTPPRDEDSPNEADMLATDSPLSRYNENAIPNKRRRIQDIDSQSPPEARPEALPRGPFVDDSDTDDEPLGASSVKNGMDSEYQNCPATETTALAPSSNTTSPDGKSKTVPVPSLKQESTSMGGRDDFDGLEDFIDDEFPEEGEEFMERRWMEEQAELEMRFEEDEEANGDATGEAKQQDMPGPADLSAQDPEASCCPICGGSTGAMAEQASRP